MSDTAFISGPLVNAVFTITRYRLEQTILGGVQ